MHHKMVASEMQMCKKYKTGLLLIATLTKISGQAKPILEELAEKPDSIRMGFFISIGSIRYFNLKKEVCMENETI